MKKLQFKMGLLLFLVSTALIAQTENIYSNSFKTNSSTTALLKFSGGSVEIQSSPDDQFYVDYNVSFENYTNKRKQDVIRKIRVKAQIIDNHITLLDKSELYSFKMNTIMGMVYKKDTLNDKVHTQKSKAQILNEIKYASLTKSLYIEYLKQKYRKDKEERDALINRYNKKRKRSVNKNFIIKVPGHIALTIEAKQTSISVSSDLKNKLSLRLDGGKLITQSLHNNHNVINVKDAVFMSKSIKGGELSLSNIKKGLIGSIDNVKLSAEFSNLEIGEILKDNRFTGFRNSLVIHNFSDNFKEFNLISEYSKIYYFKPNINYALNAYGFNTVVSMDNNIQKTKPTKNGDKIDFFKVKSSEQGLISGVMNFDITHGFIFIH